MANWINFERSCKDYLCHTFGQYADFVYKGGFNSTTSDIKVCTAGGKQFFIEAKKCPAQCGQFVLFPDILTRTFQYSTKNITPINEFSAKIIAYMNDFFDEYSDAGTEGRNIDIQTEIFISWIIQHYKDKGVKFIITNDYMLLPVEDVASYFYVTATYRIKRSGSRSVAKTKVDAVQDYLAENYNITASFFRDKKLFVTSRNKLDNEHFFIDGCEYMISKRLDKYEIRSLSDTFNANVIFSISLISGKTGLSNSEFISFLK